MKFKIINNSDLKREEVDDIVRIKDQHWKHGIASQKRWLTTNIKNDDLHFLGYSDKGLLQSYLNVVYLKCTINNVVVDGIGIGNVCVDKTLEHSGYGRQIVDKVNDYIVKTGKAGFLLCRSSVQGFYEKCGWIVIEPDEVTVAGGVYLDKVMILKDSIFLNIHTIMFDRIF